MLHADSHYNSPQLLTNQSRVTRGVNAGRGHAPADGRGVATIRDWPCELGQNWTWSRRSFSRCSDGRFGIA